MTWNEMNHWMNEWANQPKNKSMMQSRKGWINQWRCESNNEWVNQWTNQWWVNQWMSEAMKKRMNEVLIHWGAHSLRQLFPSQLFTELPHWATSSLSYLSLNLFAEVPLLPATYSLSCFLSNLLYFFSDFLLPWGLSFSPLVFSLS